MAMITNSVIIDFLLIVIPGLYLIYWCYKSTYSYWDTLNVPNLKRCLFISSMFSKKPQFETLIQFYQQFNGKRFGGIFQFHQPVLMINDLELINKIMVKDFVYFQDRGQPESKNDPVAQSLFNLKGETWRALRHKLTPTFTTGRLKGMFEQVSKCGDNMIENIEEISKTNVAVESKTLLFEFTLDVIASCAFGLQFKPKSPEFIKFKTFVENIFKSSTLLILRFGLLKAFPKFAAFINVRLFGKSIGDYFMDITKANMKYRKDNNIQRNDYFQLLLTLKEQEESGKDMITETNEDDTIVNQMQYTEKADHPSTQGAKLFTEEVICSNSFIFLLAGSETVASLISLVLFELCQHLNIQQKLQQEVDSMLAKHGGWTYDTVKDMTYLDQVVQETQRLYPGVPFLFRECLKPYNVPDSDLVMPKGLLVLIPVAALHRDPQYYPDPEQFKPERFEGNNFKPSSVFLPFGDGPRICIAMRFALLEVKTCVARIMSEFSVKLDSKTEVPLKFTPKTFNFTPKDGIWLSFKKREKVST